MDHHVHDEHEYDEYDHHNHDHHDGDSGRGLNLVGQGPICAISPDWTSFNFNSAQSLTPSPPPALLMVNNDQSQNHCEDGDDDKTALG